MWRVWLSEDARDMLLAASRRAHPQETGGVLLGVLTVGRPWVTHAMEVPPTRPAESQYELPFAIRNHLTARSRQTDRRLGYLGDWHSHPIDLGPSCKDRETMAHLAKTGDCQRPLLFLVRRSGMTQVIDARQWVRASLRCLRIVEAGALPKPRLGADSHRKDQEWQIV